MLSIICHLRRNFLAIPKMNYMNNDELHSQEIEKMFLFHCQYNPSNISVLNIFEISRMRSLFREFRFFFSAFWKPIKNPEILILCKYSIQKYYVKSLS